MHLKILHSSVHRDWPRNKPVKHRIHSERSLELSVRCWEIDTFFPLRLLNLVVTCILLSVAPLCSNCLGEAHMLWQRMQKTEENRSEKFREEMRNGSQKRESERSDDII